MTASGLPEFLTAQLDADKRAALAVDDRSDPWPGQWEFDGYGLKTRNGWSLAWPRDNDDRFRPGFGEHVARYDPARALAEVEAKRRILDEHEGVHTCGDRTYDFREWCPTLRACALPYAGRPGYLEEWRP